MEVERDKLLYQLGIASEECVDLHRFHGHQIVGAGSYATVYRALDHDNQDSPVALKYIPFQQQEKQNVYLPINIYREVTILNRIRNNNINIIKLLGVGWRQSSHQDKIYLVMALEYVAQDLAYLIDVEHVHFTVPQAKCLSLQLFDGLAYLHGENIIHRDLKMSNLLLDRQGILKIADFDSARDLLPNQQDILHQNLTPEVVSLWYRGPELLLPQQQQTGYYYSFPVDVWSAACIVSELMDPDNDPLFPGQTEIDQAKLVSDFLLGNATAYIMAWKQIANQLDTFLCKILILDPEKRLTALQATQHAFLNSLDPLPCSPSDLPQLPESTGLRQEFT